MPINTRQHRPRSKALAALPALAAAACLALAACGSSASGSSAASATAAAKHPKFGLLIMDMTNPFQATMAAAAQKEAQKLGIPMTTLNGNLSITNQVSEVQQEVAAGAKALIINAVDPNGIIPAIAEAHAANIPVIALNTAPGKGAQVVTFVGDNDYQYGLAEGQLVAQALHGKGTVALIMGQVGTSPQILRTSGIEESLAKYPGVKIVAKVADNWKNAQDLADVQDLLTKYPKGQLGAIVAEGPEIYVGAQWAASQGRTDVKFISGDFPVQVKKAIENGQLYGTVLQSPESEGTMAVELALKYVDGDKSVAQPNTYINLPLVTKSNVAGYDTVWQW